MAAPTIRSTSSGNSLTATLTVSAPASIVDGDLMIMSVVTHSVQGTPTCTGWTPISGQSATYNGGETTLLSKVASSESGSYSITLSGTGISHASILVVADADTTIAATPTPAQSSSSSQNPPASGTVTSGDYLAVAVASQEGKIAWTGDPTSYTSRGNWVSSGGGSPASHGGLAVATRELTGITSEDPSAFTSDTSDAWAAFTLLIAEPSGPPAPDTTGAGAGAVAGEASTTATKSVEGRNAAAVAGRASTTGQRAAVSVSGGLVVGRAVTTAAFSAGTAGATGAAVAGRAATTTSPAGAGAGAGLIVGRAVTTAAGPPSSITLDSTHAEGTNSDVAHVITTADVNNTAGTLQVVFWGHRNSTRTPVITDTSGGGDGDWAGPYLVEANIGDLNNRKAIAWSWRTVPSDAGQFELDWSSSIEGAALVYEFSSTVTDPVWALDSSTNPAAFGNDSDTSAVTSLIAGSAVDPATDGIVLLATGTRYGSLDDEDSYDSGLTASAGSTSGGAASNFSLFSGYKLTDASTTPTASWSTSAISINAVAAFSVTEGTAGTATSGHTSAAVTGRATTTRGSDIAGRVGAMLVGRAVTTATGTAPSTGRGGAAAAGVAATEPRKGAAAAAGAVIVGRAVTTQASSGQTAGAAAAVVSGRAATTTQRPTTGRGASLGVGTNSPLVVADPSTAAKTLATTVGLRTLART